VQLDEALDQRKAEPGARLSRLRIAALELLEDAGLVLARDTGAVVGNDERHVAALPTCGEPDGAAGGVN